MDHEIREPARVAVPSIRGYIYQTLFTVRAWLLADDDTLTIAEGNEDIDRIVLSEGMKPKAVEEQVKFRSASIGQGNEAITATILRYLQAFAYHHKRGRRFHGVLRTNAEIDANDSTEIGKWIPQQVVETAALMKEVRSLAAKPKDKENDKKKQVDDAFSYVEGNGLSKEFIDSVEWAKRASDLAPLGKEIEELVATRVPRLSPALGVSALVMRMLNLLTAADVSERVLRRIDADLALNDCLLETFERETRKTVRASRAVVWSRGGRPSIAVVVLVEDGDRLSALVERARKVNLASERVQSTQEIVSEQIRSFDFVAYASFRDQSGPRGERVCVRDVVRQVSFRHAPKEVLVATGAKQWQGSHPDRTWSAPQLVDVGFCPELVLAEVLAEAILNRDQKVLSAVDNKLRWVHQIETGEYFTSESPLK